MSFMFPDLSLIRGTMIPEPKSSGTNPCKKISPNNNFKCTTRLGCAYSKCSADKLSGPQASPRCNWWIQLSTSSTDIPVQNLYASVICCYPKYISDSHITRKLYEDVYWHSTHYSQLPLAILALLSGFSYITACVFDYFYCCYRL